MTGRGNLDSAEKRYLNKCRKAVDARRHAYRGRDHRNELNVPKWLDLVDPQISRTQLEWSLI